MKMKGLVYIHWLSNICKPSSGTPVDRTKRAKPELGAAQLVKCLLGKHEGLSQISRIPFENVRLGGVPVIPTLGRIRQVYTYSSLAGQPRLFGEFHVGEKPCLK